MRLKSAIFVSAIIRTESVNGNFATVLRKGAEEAGAIFIIHQKSRHNADMYGPVPQSMLGPDDHDRSFEKIHSDLNEGQIGEKIDAQIRFDPDCWVLEIESANDLDTIIIKNIGD